MTVHVGDRQLELELLAARGTDHRDVGKLVDEAVGGFHAELHGVTVIPSRSRLETSLTARTEAQAPMSTLPLWAICLSEGGSHETPARRPKTGTRSAACRRRKLGCAVNQACRMSFASER